MGELQWSGAFLPNALSAAVLIYAASFLVHGERFVRWSVFILIWQFLTPRRPALIDLALLNLFLLGAECIYMLVQEALRRMEQWWEDI